MDSINPFDTFFYEEGVKQYKDGKYQEALYNFNKCINSAKPSPELLFKISLCHYNLQNYELATKNMKKAIDINPIQKYLYFMGIIQIKRENYNDAIGYFTQKKETDFDNCYYLSICYYRTLRYKEAYASIKMALQFAEGNNRKDKILETLLLKFDICSELGKFEEIESDFQKYNMLTTTDSEPLVIYFSLLTLCELNKEGDFECVYKVYNKSFPDICNYMKAKFLLYKKEIAKANMYIDMVRNESDILKERNFYYIKGLIKKENNELFDVFITNYKYNLKYCPNNLNAVIELVDLYILYEDYKNAYELLKNVDDFLENKKIREYGLKIPMKKLEFLYIFKVPGVRTFENIRLMSYIAECIMKEDIRSSYYDSELIEIYSKYLELNKYYHNCELEDLIVYPKHVLGEGKHSIVYRGTLKKQEVAVKFYKLKESFHIDEAYTKNVLEKIALEVCHMEIMSDRRYILPIKCVFFLNQRKFIYLITSLCEGGSLYDVLYKEPHIEIDFNERITILLTIARGIEVIHSFIPKISHNNIKSKSILFEKPYSKRYSGQIYITNFENINTNYIELSNEPSYFAPEVILNKEFSQKSDIYSFGILLWELFSNQYPSNGLTSYEIINKIKKNDFVLPIEAMSSSHKRSNDLVILHISCKSQDKNTRPTIYQLKQEISMLQI